MTEDLRPVEIAEPLNTEVALTTVEEQPFDMALASPITALERGQEVVRWMAEKCKGPSFIAQIQGRMYPKVEWWTTVGMALGLFPVEVSSVRSELSGGGYQYEAVVEVRHNERVVTRASAICSTMERAWGARDEYAVKSMATTRATGKAYRIGLSSLAVMAGLEPTPADEVPPQGFEDQRSPRGSTGVNYGVCDIHPGERLFKRGKMRTPAHKVGDDWCNRWGEVRDEATKVLRAREQNKANWPVLIASKLPPLATRASGEYTIADWLSVARVFDTPQPAESDVSPADGAEHPAGAEPAPGGTQELPWDGPETDHAAADAEADANAEGQGW